MNYRMQRISGISCAALAILLSSCADDGFDDKERFTSSTQNAQLQSPRIEASDLSVVNNPDGTESVRVQWPVVPGAIGYQASVAIVEDPQNPEYIVKDKIIDGCSMTFDRREDTFYKIYITALGDKKLNNTDAPEPSVVDYSSYVTAIDIPEGEEISAFINANLPEPGQERVRRHIMRKREPERLTMWRIIILQWRSTVTGIRRMTPCWKYLWMRLMRYRLIPMRGSGGMIKKQKRRRCCE